VHKDNVFKLMEVCGTHTMSIARFGIKKLLPEGIKLVSGPGCPVCVTSQNDIDTAIEIARIKGVIMATFGDMMRVPGSLGSLEEIRRGGGDIRVVYSCLDALNMARANPRKQVVFMGVGFETTSPTIASTILEAKKRKIRNFFVLPNFKLIFPALQAIAKSKKLKIDGFICPGHVSVITGSAPYEKIAKRYKKPCVITGFDPMDIFKGIKQLVTNIKEHRYGAEIAYERAVRAKGNRIAMRVLWAVFRKRSVEWRGLGMIKRSGLKLRKKYKEFDAEKKFNVKIVRSAPPKACICGEVLQGAKSPQDCRMFKKVCTPGNPVGPCMVSSEGTCAAWYKYGE